MGHTGPQEDFAIVTTLQELELEASELRDALNAMAADSEADETAINEMTAKYRKVEARRRAAIAAQAGDATPSGEPETRETRDGEARERDRLLERAELRRFVAAAWAGSNGPDGVEAEVRAAFDIPETGANGGVLIPWEMLLDREAEMRADTVTTTLPTDRRPHRTTLARVFAGSILEYLGVRPRAVPVGEAAYAVVTGGVSPAPVAAGTAADAEAATITSETLSPVRTSTAYRWRVESAATFVGLEDVLRADLRGAMTRQLSNIVLNGTGTAPQPEGFIAGLSAPSTVPTAASAFADFAQASATAVDGLYAETLAGTRLLVGVASYRLAAGIFYTGSTGQAESAASYATRSTGGFRATSLIAAPATISTQDNIQNAIAFARDSRGSAVLPVWNALEMVRDPYSGAASGEVRLQCFGLYNFAVLRDAPWTRVYFRTA